MKTETANVNLQEKVCINMPGEIVDNLNKIASLNNSEVESVVHSYIVDGIANDSHKAKRMEFTNKINEILSKYNIPPKTIEDIFENLA